MKCESISGLKGLAAGQIKCRHSEAIAGHLGGRRARIDAEQHAVVKSGPGWQNRSVADK